jgi:hypothetical protein
MAPRSDERDPVPPGLGVQGRGAAADGEGMTTALFLAVAGLEVLGAVAARRALSDH